MSPMPNARRLAHVENAHARQRSGIGLNSAVSRANRSASGLNPAGNQSENCHESAKTKKASENRDQAHYDVGYQVGYEAGFDACIAHITATGPPLLAGLSPAALASQTI
jgi:hypothetical protein